MAINNDGLTAEARSFYKVINQIKLMYNNSTISEEDRKKVTELLRVLKYKIQFDILNDCINNDNYITSILAGIDTKLLHIDEERAQIKREIADMDLVADTKRLVVLRKISNDLEKIKVYIDQRKFDFYVTEMNAGLKTTSELITACNLVLSSGLHDYTTIFGNTLVKDESLNKKGIDELFEILLDPAFKEDLRKYARANQAYLDVLAIKEHNDEFLRLVKLASKNQVTLREYLRNRGVLSESSKESWMKNRETLATDRLVLDNLPTDGIAGIFNKKQRENLQIEIYSCEHQIEEYESRLEEVKKLEQILINVGLGEVIEALSNTNYEQELSAVERAAMYIKTACGKTSFDYLTAESTVKRANHSLESKLSVARANRDRAIIPLYNKPYSLVKEHPEDVSKVVDLLIDTSPEGLSPLLAAFILKAISDTRGLDYRDIIDMCSLDIDVEELHQVYSKEIQEEVLGIQDQVTEIQLDEERLTEEYHKVK